MTTDASLQQTRSLVYRVMLVSCVNSVHRRIGRDWHCL